MTLTPDQTNALTDRLAKLQAATTVDEIVELLSTHEVSGYRKQACNCPLANYLQSALPILATVSPVRCIVQSEDQEELIISREWDREGAIPQFITRFDLGHFPRLDANLLFGKKGD